MFHQSVWPIAEVNNDNSKSSWTEKYSFQWGKVLEIITSFLADFFEK